MSLSERLEAVLAEFKFCHPKTVPVALYPSTKETCEASTAYGPLVESFKQDGEKLIIVVHELF